jgi:hypothetical protein
MIISLKAIGMKKYLEKMDLSGNRRLLLLKNFLSGNMKNPAQLYPMRQIYPPMLKKLWMMPI